MNQNNITVTDRTNKLLKLSRTGNQIDMKLSINFEFG